MLLDLGEHEQVGGGGAQHTHGGGGGLGGLRGGGGKREQEGVGLYVRLYGWLAGQCERVEAAARQSTSPRTTAALACSWTPGSATSLCQTCSVCLHGHQLCLTAPCCVSAGAVHAAGVSV